MTKPTLTLRRDTLGQLTTDELAAVVGAAAVAQDDGLGTKDCIALTDLCPTWDCTGCYLTCGC